MGMGKGSLRWTGLALLALCLDTPALAQEGCLGAEAPLDLYEWMAPAPIVVAGRALQRDGGWHDAEVLAVARGEVAPGTRIRIDVRSANRERNPRLRPLQLEPGARYLLLLEPLAPHRQDPRPRFRLVRGIRGVESLPPERQGVLLQALRAFAALQTGRSEEAAWRTMTQWLEATNPVVLETALRQFLRYARADLSLLGYLVPLSEHPQERIRCLAVKLIGTVLRGAGPFGAEMRENVFAALVARARTDSAVGVRVAATVALASLEGTEVERVLEEIARADPDQEVRLAAARVRLGRATPAPP